MKTTFRTLLAAAMMTIGAGAAVADGYTPAKAHAAPPPPAADCCATPSWRGFYIGAYLGYGQVSNELTLEGVPGFTLEFDGISSNGGFAGLAVGYDVQLADRFVAGVFAEYDFANIKSELAVGIGPIGIDLDFLKISRVWSIGARLGFLSSPTTLWYGTIGYSRASFDDIGLTLGGTTISLGLEDVGGVFIGAGVESRITQNLSLKGEVRYTMFEDQCLFCAGGAALNFEPTMLSARVGLAYRFDFGHHSAAAPLK